MPDKEHSSSEKKARILPMAAIAAAAFLLGAGAFGLIQKGRIQPKAQADADTPSVLSGALDAENAQLQALAEKYDITVGKASLILEVTTQKPELAFESLVPMTINEIAQILSGENAADGGKNQGTAGETLAGRELSGENASAAEVLVQGNGQDVTAEGAAQANAQDAAADGAPTQGNEGTSSARNNTAGSDTYIGEAAAKEAALADAGVKESDTSYMNCYVDYDDGRARYYKAEFFVGNTEYEYEIDLYSGAVLEKSMDTHYSHHNNSGMAGSGSYIGEDAAWAAALGHAGLKEAEVSKKKIKLDEDDGVMVYEVEFDKGRTEYDYEIHAVTGEVLQAETDMN